MSDISKVKSNAVDIFKYLEELFSLNIDTRRDFRVLAEQEWMCEVRNFPESDNIFVRKLNDSNEDDDLFVSVQKKDIDPPPELPKELTEWVDLEKAGFSKPEHKEFIFKKISFTDDKKRIQEFKNLPKNQSSKVPKSLEGWVTKNEKGELEKIQEREFKFFFSDFPELIEMYDNYIAGPWDEWRKKNEPIFKANQVYDDLYGLRTFLKTEKENFDLLWTHDLITWKKDGEEIYHPLFLTPVTLEFFPEGRKIEIRKDNTSKTVFETSFLEGLEIPNILDIHEESKKLNTEEYDVWNKSALKLKGGEIVGCLSSDGIEKLSEEILEPEISEVPAYWYFPTVLLRKKSNIDWAKYAQKIQQDIDQAESLPPFITELSGGEVDENNGEKSDEENSESTNISDGELYFPLPWNDEQREIANKIEARYGVVVQGPPGTGKSHTIANLLSRFLAQGKSVLVTSQTGKALEVLKDKIPPEIKDLVVSQVNSDARQDDLQSAVTTINANLDDTTKFTQKKLDDIREQLKEIRKEKAELLSRIKKWVLLDIEESLTIDGKHLSPTEAAKELSAGREKGLLWLKDNISKDTELNFSENDIHSTSELLASLDINERNYFEQWLPDIKHLPSIEEAEKFFERYAEVFELQKKWERFLSQKKPKKDLDFQEEEIRQILKKAKEARSVLSSIDKKWEEKLFELVLGNKEEKNKWKDRILPQLEQKVQKMRQLQNDLSGHEVKHNTTYTIKELLRIVNDIEKKLEGKTSLGVLQKIILPKPAKEILHNFTVFPDDVNEQEGITLLKKQLEYEQAIEQVRVLWNQAFEQSAISDFEKLDDPFVLHRFDDRLKGMSRILNFENNFRELQQFIEKNQIFSETVYTDKHSVENLISVLEALLASFEIKEYEQVFSNWKEELKTENGHAIISDICLAIDNRDTENLRNLYAQLADLQDKKKRSEKLRELREKISQFAPKLYREIQEGVDGKGKYHIPNDLEIAWRLARISSWLKEIHSDKSVSQLQEDLERVENRERDKESELIATAAWKNQKEKVTRGQRQALSAYANAAKRIPKTRNAKTRPYWEKQAREALQEAKEAVPIWIMPLSKVLHMFSEPKAEMFDVVIFDESSQVDVRGVNIAYLGKKLLVVGDPEQISPDEGSFTKHDEVISLVAKHLSSIKHGSNFTLTNSLFDIAAVMMTDKIMLLEHFRSVEEIISFSNKLAYDGKLKILRYPYPKWQLKPALEAVHIENGFMNINNQVNEPEAEAVVDKLVELLHDPKYKERDNEKGGTRPTTFGVVTLLGNDQGKYITDLIRQRISEEEIEKRKIIAGNPYTFQGDERDVMLVSLVKAPDQKDPDKKITPLPVSKKGNKQRVNVAMSRARDKEILFHSFLRKELTNENDLRAQMMDWFYNPQKEKIKWGREALQEEFTRGRASQFEVDVGNIILNKGYKVIPQFEVAGYRIDLVIQGENARLAVECDGDQYHGPDRWADDLERETILRRAGWEFWRVTGSAFYKHEEDALQSLWTKLEEMGIKPIN
ncbi:MAG: AAA domain-containing protein [Patescibacteria group bacterium]